MLGPCGTATRGILILPVLPLSAFSGAISQPVPVVQPWALATSAHGESRQGLGCHSKAPDQLGELISGLSSRHHHIKMGTLWVGQGGCYRKRRGTKSAPQNTRGTLWRYAWRTGELQREESASRSSGISSRDAAPPSTLNHNPEEEAP